MTRSQTCRARKAERREHRAAEVERMQLSAEVHQVGKFTPHAPEVTGAMKRRRRSVGGQRQRRGYLVPLGPGVEFDTYERDTAGASSASR